MSANLHATTVRVDIPEWALQTGQSDGLARVSVTPSLKPDDLDEADSTHALGSGLVTDERWPWDPDAEGLFTQLVGDPWRAPGTRMIGFSKSGDLHTCDAVDNVGVFLFVNPTDVVFGTTPCPLWIVTVMEYDENTRTSYAFVDPYTADNWHHQQIAEAESACDECW